MMRQLTGMAIKENYYISKIIIHITSIQSLATSQGSCIMGTLNFNVLTAFEYYYLSSYSDKMDTECNIYLYRYRPRRWENTRNGKIWAAIPRGETVARVGNLSHGSILTRENDTIKYTTVARKLGTTVNGIQVSNQCISPSIKIFNCLMESADNKFQTPFLSQTCQQWL